MDDHIVCKFSEPIFARAYDNVIWVLLIEKAYAKLHGSYSRIEGGMAYQAMRDLTGAPSYVYDVDMPEMASNLL